MTLLIGWERVHARALFTTLLGLELLNNLSALAFPLKCLGYWNLGILVLRMIFLGKSIVYFIRSQISSNSSILRSYTDLCNLLLDRINCPTANKTVFASPSPTYVKGAPTASFTCECGQLTQPSSYLNNLIMDKLNDYQLKTTPVFVFVYPISYSF